MDNMNQPLLRLEDVSVQLGRGDNAIRPVDGISLAIRKGETFALLGESGCGKSMTALSILRLLPQPIGRITDGKIWLGDEELTALAESDMRRIRGRRISMIFQEPMTSLNPVLTVGDQIAEVLKQHHRMKGRAATDRVVELLDGLQLCMPGNWLKKPPGSAFSAAHSIPTAASCLIHYRMYASAIMRWQPSRVRYPH